MKRDGLQAGGRRAARGQRKKAWVQVNISSGEVAEMAALAKASGSDFQTFAQHALRNAKATYGDRFAPDGALDARARIMESLFFHVPPELERALRWFKGWSCDGPQCQSLAGLARLIVSLACLEPQTLRQQLAQVARYCLAEDLDPMAYLNSRLAGVPEYRKVKLAAAA